MRRVSVRALVPGQSLGEQIYDNTGKLLLARGNQFTNDMMLSVLRSGTEHVYLGEWDADAVARYEAATPLADYKEAAEEMADKLERKVEQRLNAETDLDVAPEGNPLEGEVDKSLQTDRSEARLQEWANTCDQGVGFASDVIQGQIEDTRVAEAATAVVDKVVDAFKEDPSLLVNFVNRKSRVEYLYTHSMNVAVLAINIGTALQYDADQIRDLGIAGLLHDMGMSMVPENILNVPGKLASVDFIDIQKHCVLALYLLERMKGLPPRTAFVAYQHHERADGSGYPKRLGTGLIHKYARIVGVADSYDAMTSERPYRKAFHPYRAMEQLIRDAHVGKFEGEVVRGLLRCLSLYPLGCLVRLNTREVAKVIHSNAAAMDRPVVSVLFDAQGNRLSSPEVRDLFQEEELRVASVVEGEDVALAEGFMNGDVIAKEMPVSSASALA